MVGLMPAEVVYQGRYGPSGAASALFDLVKHNRTLETETKKSELREKEASQASDLKMTEATQAHGFSTALETLRENARALQAKEAFDRSEALGLLKAQAEAQAVGETAQTTQAQGIEIPGIPTPPMTMGGPGGETTPPPAIPPYGAGVYKDLIGRGVQAHLEKGAKKQEQADLLAQKLTLDALGRVGDDEVRSAATMASQIETIEPDSIHAKRLRSFVSGKSDRDKEYAPAMNTAALELDRLQSAAKGRLLLSETRLKIMRETNETREKVANIAAKSKVDARDLQTLRAAQTNVTAQLSHLRGQSQITIQRAANLPQGSRAWELANKELDEIQQAIIPLEMELAKIGQQIARGDRSIDPVLDDTLIKQRIKTQVIQEMFKGKKTEDRLTDEEQLRVAKEIVKRFKAGQDALKALKP